MDSLNSRMACVRTALFQVPFRWSMLYSSLAITQAMYAILNSHKLKARPPNLHVANNTQPRTKQHQVE